MSTEGIAYSVNSMNQIQYNNGEDYYTGNQYPTGYANPAYSNYSGYSAERNYPTQGRGKNYPYDEFHTYDRIPAMTQPGHPHTELDIERVAKMKEKRDADEKKRQDAKKKPEIKMEKNQNFQNTNLSVSHQS